MSKTEELEKQVTGLKAELDALRERLNKIFEHPDLSLDVRREWWNLTRSVVVESPAVPTPPEIGEAQQNLDTIIALEKVFAR